MTKEELGQLLGNAIIECIERHPNGVTMEKCCKYTSKKYPVVDQDTIVLVCNNVFGLLIQNHLVKQIGKKTFRPLTKTELNAANKIAVEMRREALHDDEQVISDENQGQKH